MQKPTTIIQREVRFAVTSEAAGNASPESSTENWPSSDRMTPHLVLRFSVRGPIHPSSGLVCNVIELDQVLKRFAVPRICDLYYKDSRVTPGRILLEIFPVVAENCPPETVPVALTISITPWLNVSCQAGDSPMIHLTRSYEFSASHRLHSNKLSENENLKLFGKCGHPEGHGHNYRFDITVTGELDPETGILVPLDILDSLVRTCVLDRFDHKNLNTDCPELEDRNPTVENIALIIRESIQDQLPCRLHSVKVWETEKTWAESLLEE